MRFPLKFPSASVPATPLFPLVPFCFPRLASISKFQLNATTIVIVYSFHAPFVSFASFIVIINNIIMLQILYFDLKYTFVHKFSFTFVLNSLRARLDLSLLSYNN